MRSIVQDIRLAFRMLWKRPGFAFITLSALALGIGANTAVFSVVNGVLLRPLGFDEPGQLYMVWQTFVSEGVEAEAASPGNFLSWDEQNTVFQDLAAFTGRSVRLRQDGEPEVVNAGAVSPNLFRLLGTAPQIGGGFTAFDTAGQPLKEAIFSHRFWQRTFAGDSAIVGKSVNLDGEAYTVVGVMPADFRFLMDADLWLPLVLTGEDRQERGSVYLSVVGRLRDGVTADQAQANMTSIAKRLEDDYPATNLGWGVSLMPLQEFWVGGVSHTLPLLLGAVIFVLLVACANIATLLLIRSTERRREMALRQSLGAGRSQLIRQTLIESLVLGMLGGAAGVIVGAFAIALLVKFQPGNIPRMDEVSIDLPVLLFTFLVSILAGIGCGLVPAIQGTRPDLTPALKEGSSNSSASGPASLLRSVFVVSGIALAMVLLIGAALMVRSFQRLQQVDIGFEPTGATAVEFSLSPDRFPQDAQRARFIEELLASLNRVPSIQAVGVVSTLPLENSQMDVDIFVPGRSSAQLPSVVGIDAVSAGYFRALGTRVLEGRDFEESDRQDSLRVVIVNKSLADVYWPGQSPVGQELRIAGFAAQAFQVIGVVQDIRRFGLETEARREIYLPFLQFEEVPSYFFAVVRTKAEASEDLAATVRGIVLDIDPEQPVASVEAMDSLLADTLSRRRFNTWLIGLSALVGLLLAVLGIYGILGYTVAQSAREIGIRLALGETQGAVLGLVLKRGLKLTGIGLGIGLVVVFLLSHIIASLLYGVGVADPLTLVGVSLIFLAVATLASYFPARRATRVDPMVALRSE